MIDRKYKYIAKKISEGIAHVCFINWSSYKWQWWQRFRDSNGCWSTMSCTNIFNWRCYISTHFVFTLLHWCQWCYQWWYTHVIRYAQRSHCCRSLNQSRCTLLVIDRIIDRKTSVSISWMVFFFIFDQDDFLLYLTSDQLSLARFVAFTNFLAFIWSKFDSHHSSIAWEMWRMDEPPQVFVIEIKAIWDFSCTMVTLLRMFG